MTLFTSTVRTIFAASLFTALAASAEGRLAVNQLQLDSTKRLVVDATLPVEARDELLGSIDDAKRIKTLRAADGTKRLDTFSIGGSVAKVEYEAGKLVGARMSDGKLMRLRVGEIAADGRAPYWILNESDEVLYQGEMHAKTESERNAIRLDGVRAAGELRISAQRPPSARGFTSKIWDGTELTPSTSSCGRCDANYDIGMSQCDFEYDIRSVSCGLLAALTTELGPVVVAGVFGVCMASSANVRNQCRIGTINNRYECKLAIGCN